MWCYQKPEFEALLLAELQKQQQCSQFCDTLLKAEGVSVPVHSCVFAAISPQMSSALSSMPAPPAGQRRVLEFGSFGARTLLHVVRLLYSGEVAGDCDEERREVISAAATLGIRGLAEGADRRPESGGRRTEVGVQTEERRDTWRREVRDGSTLLWRERVSEGQKDTCTQTEEPDVNAAQPTTFLKTIDTSALHFVHTHVPNVPISLVYRSDDNGATHPPSIEDSSAGHASDTVVAPSYSSVPTSFNLISNQMALCAAEPPSRWTSPPASDRDAAAGDDWADEQLEQFQDNIPGFINHFLNPDSKKVSHRRPARRGRGGARGAATSQVKPGGRGRRRGQLTQIVDSQDVDVSKMQKLFPQRGWGRATMPGQGGGAVGRKLYQRSRELVKRGRGRRAYTTHWELSHRGNTLVFSGRGRGRPHGNNKQCEGRNTQQDLPPAGRARRTRAKPPTSPSPLHTPSPPPPAAPCQEEQPVHIDRLLEEVMMGLDILSDGGGAAAAPCADPNGVRSLRSICASSPNDLTQSKQTPASGEVPVLQQQQEEGELTDILDHFLHSFEQHIYNCSARHDKDAAQPSPGQHGSVTAAAPRLRSARRRLQQHSCCQAGVRAGKRTRKATAPPEQAGAPSGRTGGKRGRKRKWTPQNVLSSKTKEPRMSREQDEQLRQRPVVTLERCDALWTTDELSQDVDVTPQNPSLLQSGDRQVLPDWSSAQEPSLHEQGDQEFQFKSNGLVSSSSEGPTPQIPCCVEEQQPERRREGEGEGSAVSEVRGQKRTTADGDDASAAKTARVERDAEDVVDVETVPAAGDTVWSETQAASVGPDALDGVTDVEKAPAPPPFASPRSCSEQQSSEEEDVDVTGGFSPLPGAVSISWTEEEEEGDEDIDVV